MLKPIRTLVVVLSVALVMTACGNRATPEPTPTRTPRPTFTPTPVGQVANNPLFQTPIPENPTPVLPPTDTPVPPTDTPAPTPTPEPPTPTPTPLPAQVYANQAINVRSGPGVTYARIGTLTPGQRYLVTGKNPVGDWWQIDYNGRIGWVTDSLVVKEGAFEMVTVAANIPPPPTPRPTQPPTPTRPPAPTPTPAPVYAFTLLRGVERCDPNPGITYFEGFVRDRNNNPVNGVCVHIAFYGPRNTKCSGCDGVGAGKWGFAPFGPNPAPPNTPVEIFVVPCPASMPPAGQTLDTGFGDLTPQSEKWTRTIVSSEQCTGITFIKN
jgi:hypothetical protein